MTAELVDREGDGNSRVEESLPANNRPPAADVNTSPNTGDVSEIASLDDDVTTSIPRSSLTDQQIKDAVETHNRLRRREGSSDIPVIVRTNFILLSHAPV